MQSNAVLINKTQFFLKKIGLLRTFFNVEAKQSQEINVINSIITIKIHRGNVMEPRVHEKALTAHQGWNHDKHNTIRETPAEKKERLEERNDGTNNEIYCVTDRR